MATGYFRLLSKSTHLSERSDLISAAVPYMREKVSFTTTYQENGLPRFEWPSVSGAKSYRYRYEPQDAHYCTQDTSFTVPVQPTQPSIFYIEPFTGADCSGTSLGASDWVGWTAQPSKPAKLAGITIKSIWYEYVEFDIPNLDPTAQLRIYRSDGLMLRLFPGQRITVGMQNNEDVNGKVFSYRFVQLAVGPYSQSWSEPSDPVSVTLPALAAPIALCSDGSARLTINCSITPVSGTNRTRIEFLGSDKTVLGSTEITNQSQKFKHQFRVPRGVAFIRVAATLGEANSRNSWYRRGESKLVEKTPNRKTYLFAEAF